MIKKKSLVCLLAIVTLAMPVASSVSINSSFAEKVEFLKQDEEGSKTLANAKYDIYEIGKDAGSDVKLFSVSTNENGKFDPKSVKIYTDISNPVDSNGDLDLRDGSYYAVEVKAPENYMLNVKSEIFNVVKGQVSNINAINKKFPSGFGQVVVKVTDKRNGAGITGANIELAKKDGSKYTVIGNFSSDNEGYLIGGEANVDLYNGTLVLPEGKYRLVETSIVGSYDVNKEYRYVDVTKGNTSSVNIENTYNANPSTTTNTQTPSSQSSSSLFTVKDKNTGVKIKIISANNSKPLNNKGVAVYTADNNKKVFDGYTDKYGYLTSKDAKFGKDLVSNDVLYLSPGKYYYQLTGYKNAVKHNFLVEKGKIGNQTLKLNIEGSSSNIKKSNYKSTLAKTGFENTTIYTVAGMTLLLAGFILLKHRKLD